MSTCRLKKDVDNLIDKIYVSYRNDGQEFLLSKTIDFVNVESPNKSGPPQSAIGTQSILIDANF